MIAEPAKRHHGRGTEAVQLMMAYAHRFLVVTLIPTLVQAKEEPIGLGVCFMWVLEHYDVSALIQRRK